ncbi:MAG: DnaJ domain-containing protein [Acidobacteria bacterium]|nr:DnaJ domain-containing protein [Acidobacteriota bacterium]
MPINCTLLNTLWELHNSSRSGVLRIERGLEKKQLVLLNGSLMYAESNLPDEHLARIIVKLNLLPRSKVNEIASLMKSGKTSEDAVLALCDSGMQDLEKARHEQAILILATLLSWDECVIHFYPGENLVRCRIGLGMPLLDAITASARRAVSDHLIRVPPGFPEGTICWAEDPAGITKGFPLNNAEAYAYSLLGEPVNPVQIFPLIPDAGRKPEEILLCLFALGLITIKKPSAQNKNGSAADDVDSVLLKLEDMLVSFETSSLYDILSVAPEAGHDDIQAAYHKMAKQFHPDRFQSKHYSDETRSKAEQVFTYINKAYMTLKDPVFRTDYDEKRLRKESKVEAELKARAGGQADDEKTAEAIYREGRSLLAKGEHEKAVEHLKACVWLCPEKAKYNHFLGVAESEFPKLRKTAEQHLLKALQLDNTSVASRLELAKLYIKVALRRKAEIQLEELMRWDPANPEVLKLADALKHIDKASTGRTSKNPFALL